MLLLIIALNVDRVEKISLKNARAHCRGRKTKEIEEERKKEVREQDGTETACSKSH